MATETETIVEETIYPMAIFDVQIRKYQAVLEELREAQSQMLSVFQSMTLRMIQEEEFELQRFGSGYARTRTERQCKLYSECGVIDFRMEAKLRMPKRSHTFDMLNEGFEFTDEQENRVTLIEQIFSLED